MVANADGTAERKLATRRIPGRASMGVPAWSPDGKIIVYPVDSLDAGGSYMTLAEVLVADGSEKPITSQQWSRVDRLAWLRDGSGLVFTARERVASPSQIWYLSYPGGRAHRITNDLNDYLGVSLSGDSAALVTVEADQVSNIWIVSNDNARVYGQITYSKFDGVKAFRGLPTARSSMPRGQVTIWIFGWQRRMEQGKNNSQLMPATTDARRFHPTVDMLFLFPDRTGTDHIWRIDIDGGNARQLTNGDAEGNPQCSPNGQWVLYRLRFGKTGVWGANRWWRN